MRRLTNTPAFDVPATIPPGYERLLRKTPSFWSQTIIDGVRYQTLFYRSNRQHTPSEPPAIFTVSVPEPTTGRILEFVLRMNAIGLIYGAVIVLILLIARQVAIRRLRFTLKFRDRIFLIVLLIALVPLVVVTNVTRTLLTERAHSEQQDRLTRDALVIRDRIAQQIEGVSAATLPSPTLPARDLQIDVDDLSQIIGRDFSVYDPNGRLRASSRPELYESGMLASILDASAFEEIVLGKRLSYERPVRIGSETYQVGYQPVTSSNGAKLLGVIALATMEEQSRIESEIARTTSFIYGTFAALGLVLLGMGALFAARVASPVLALIRATERVGQGKLTTSIPVTREDEIGELMQAFNSMTRELEKSREIVAQTEREFAWKEMARQVAHEIKNPLTPMKLSVQHLEHAHETKDPNFNSIFRRVIRTVSEQIDVLTRIATEFSRFGAMPRRKWGPVSLRRVADSAVALFDAERSRIRFVVEVPKDLPLLHSDEDELRRAFVNLIRNGIQAMAGWGIIVIRAEQDEGMVHVRLSDTGAGMSEATLKRVFDPNFSTKTSGMGLGLAIVKKTITDMSGSIRVESRLGHGTTFFIDLPARGYVEEEE
jgi:nitrogen fixation/metabolism regulation signal transduction histidine kinase